jgi:hypothetical protein
MPATTPPFLGEEYEGHFIAEGTQKWVAQIFATDADQAKEKANELLIRYSGMNIELQYVIKSEKEAMWHMMCKLP